MTPTKPRLRAAVLLGAGLLGAAALGCSEATPTLSDHRLYVTVSGTAEVLVLDGESLEQIESISVGQGPAILLNTPNNQKLYTANWADQTISSIDVATSTASTIDPGGKPYVIAMAPDGERLYAGLDTNAIVAIDTATDTVVSRWATGELPASLIVSPDSRTLYVATLGLVITPGTLRAISTVDGSVVHDAINVGAIPAWITIHPDGSKVYTFNFVADTISVVDTASFRVETTISDVGTQAIIANCTTDGRNLLVTNYGSSDLSIIDTMTNQLVRMVALGGRPVGVIPDLENVRVYTTDFGAESLQANFPGLDFLLNGEFTTTGPGNVSMIDIQTGDVLRSVATGPGPTSVVVLPAPAAL